MSERLFEERITEESDFNTLELQAAKAAAFHDKGVWGILERYGSYQTHEFSSSEKITILPTCTIPLDYLVRENWVKRRPWGNFREVTAIESLSDGTDPQVVIKSPERVLTKYPRYLDAGYPFWGGPRSGHKAILIRGNAVVEEQSIWEAIVLLELYRIGVRAERPQALLEDKEGRRELVVKRIPIYGVCDHRPRPKKQGPTEEELREYININSQLEPDDLASHNLPMDTEGYTHIIDVNRWAWPPLTDEFRQRLIQVITDEERKII